LWLLLFAPALFIVVFTSPQRRQRRLNRLGKSALLRSQISGEAKGRHLGLHLVGALGWILLVFALAGPSWGAKTEVLPRRGLDVVIALDVSKSMRARDVLPDRLERARAEVSALLDQVGQNRVALVAFAGSAFVQCPLTTDVEAARTFLMALGPKSAPAGGSALGEGIGASLRLFAAEAEHDPEAVKAGRVLVVITDGEDHQGNLDVAAKAVAEAGVDLTLIGVGSAMGEPIPVVDEKGTVTGYLKDKEGQTVMSRMNPKALVQLAQDAGGNFIDGAQQNDLGMAQVLERIRALEKRDLKARVRTFHTERFGWPLLAACLLVFGFILVPRRRRRKTRQSALFSSLLLGLASFFALPTLAQQTEGSPMTEPGSEEGLFLREEPHLSQGRTALGQGRWDAALKSFEKAQPKNENQRASLLFNQALTHLERAREMPNAEAPTENPEADPKKMALDQSQKLFSEAHGRASNNQLQSEAALGLGNAQIQAGDLKGAVESYRKSLVADPDNQRARLNLARALMALRRNPPPPTPQGGGQDEEKDKKGGDEGQNSQGEGEDKPQTRDSQESKAEESQGEKGQEPQMDPQAPEEKEGQKASNPGQKPPQSPKTQDGKNPPQKPSTLSKEEAKRLLDALRQQEAPLSPGLMRPQQSTIPPTSKDW
jgi:Ca-activated chloride channel family protein